jgi:hypothetical protein
MLEYFTYITEFCRHFYTMLNREGPSAPHPGTPAAEKVNKIVLRLGEYEETLVQKKSALHAAEHEPSGKKTRPIVHER